MWQMTISSQMAEEPSSAHKWFIDMQIPDFRQLLLSSAFVNTKAALDWITADTIHPWIDGPKTATRGQWSAKTPVCKWRRQPEGRVILMCSALWLAIQKKKKGVSAERSLQCCWSSTFLRSRCLHNANNCRISDVRFRTGRWGSVTKETDGCRASHGYWTVKQKSLLCQVPPIIKFRPKIAHSFHIEQSCGGSDVRCQCLAWQNGQIAFLSDCGSCKT